MPGQNVIALTKFAEHAAQIYLVAIDPPFGEGRVARAAFRWRWLVAIGALVLGSLLVPAPSQPLGQPLQSNGIPTEEPITPIPVPPAIDPRKIKLGERLFGDVRLSHDNSRSAAARVADRCALQSTRRDHSRSESQAIAFV
jgi:hypothetical protein